MTQAGRRRTGRLARRFGASAGIGVVLGTVALVAVALVVGIMVRGSGAGVVVERGGDEGERGHAAPADGAEDALERRHAVEKDDRGAHDEACLQAAHNMPPQLLNFLIANLKECALLHSHFAFDEASALLQTMAVAVNNFGAMAYGAA